MGARNRPGRCRSASVRGTLGVTGHEIAPVMGTPPIPHVAGALSVAPRPAKRGCRSALLGRGWERPPCSACLDRHREGSARTSPCLPPRGVSPSQQSRAGRPNGEPVRGVPVLVGDAGQPSGQPVGQRVRRLEAALEPPSRVGITGQVATPRGAGTRVRKRSCPRTRTEPSARGVATVTARAVSAPRANGAARPKDVAAPAAEREGRCAPPDGQSAHRPPTSFPRFSTAPSRSAG